MRPSIRTVYLLLGSVLISLTTQTVVVAQENVETILNDWHRRQGKMAGVKYVFEGDCVAMKGSYTDPELRGVVPPEDYKYKRHVVLFLDFERNRVRKEVREERLLLNDGKFYPHFDVQLFDGERFQQYSPAKDNALGRHPADRFPVELDLQTDRYANVVLGNDDFPLLYAHGAFPSAAAGISPKLLRTPIAKEWYGYHGDATIKDRSCLVLRTQPFASGSFGEYWIDVEEESAVRRLLAYDGKGRLTLSLDISHQRTPHGWLPQSWSLSLFDSKGKLRQTETYELNGYEANPVIQASDFHMERVPGMIVDDVATGRVFRVGKPGEPDVDVAVLLAEGQSGGERGRGKVIVLCSLAAAAVAALLCWQRYKNRVR